MPEFSSSVPQSSSRRRPSIGIVPFLIALLIVGIIGFVVGTRQGEISGIFGVSSGEAVNFSTAEEVYSILRKEYDGPIDNSKLSDGAARGLTAGLGDRYTVYMDAKETTEFEDALSGRFSGIGAEIGKRSGQPTIVRLVDNSPAKNAGLQPGDVVTKVNDTSTVGFDVQKTASLIRGEAGTTVNVTVTRGTESKQFTMTRASVTDSSVDFKRVGEVGVITIRRFDSDTGSLASRAAAKLVSDGATKFILDLRDDGGGELAQTQSVAGLWLDNKLVVTVRKGDVVQESLNSTGSPILAGKKTVVLINGSSASASEVVTGALKDYKAAYLIGEKSFGKGSVQQVFPLKGGAELKVTISRWYTPNGTNVGDNGITPDATVELTAEDADAGRDPQMDAAIKWLNT